MDVCDNISPGIAWPPRQTTICPLGPSAVSPISSALTRFRPEFEAKIRAGMQQRAATAPQTPINEPAARAHG
jgi:NADH-quinone oxidoreductase subunit F